MDGIECPICNIASEILSTTNEWKYYCPHCDRRFNRNKELMPDKEDKDNRDGQPGLADRELDKDTQVLSQEITREILNDIVGAPIGPKCPHCDAQPCIVRSYNLRFGTEHVRCFACDACQKVINFQLVLIDAPMVVQPGNRGGGKLITM